MATAAILTLALGIGANAAIFPLLDALLRPPPFEHLDRLVELWSSNPQEVPFDVNASPADFLDLGARANRST